MKKLPIVALMWFALVIACAPPSNRSSRSSANEAAGPSLELLSSRVDRSSEMFVTVNGQVRNISGEKLDNVMVVIEWYDGAGSLITSDDVLLKYNPIMPGQTSPFQVITSYNPQMQRYVVNFKGLWGDPISFRDISGIPESTPKKSKR